jgi:membrane-bound lytic murein transglycosylase D
MPFKLAPLLAFALLFSPGLYADEFEQSSEHSLSVTGDPIAPPGAASNIAATPVVQDDFGSTLSRPPQLEMDASMDGPLAPDLWERIRNGYALSEMNGPLVRENEEWYAKRPDYMARMIERSKLYLFYIVEEVEKRGMPTEIALLPIVESAFNPKAYSRSHASGIWQFVPATGKDFGLEQNFWYDGRRDIPAATGAALDYLQKLHKMFGNWELALAAYNWGEGAVSRAMSRNRAKGKPTDYLSLTLPRETRQYVPRLIAIKNIIMNPAAHGLELASVPNQPYFTRVANTVHIDVKLAARLAGVPLDEFVSLNPAYNRPVVKPSRANTLLLPVDKAETFTSNLELYSQPLVSWQAYTAKRGERLGNIAHKFGTTAALLKQNNSISPRKDRLGSNLTLLVPMGAKGDPAELLPVNLKSAKPVEIKTTYVVRRGDNLFRIAQRFGTTQARLMSWNKMKSAKLTHGQKLVIARLDTTGDAQAPSKPQLGKRTFYTVHRGDTLISIAKHFKVATQDILRWNNLSGKRTLRAGNKVALYLAKI